MPRRHHRVAHRVSQVSHHIQCNDEALDEDVFSAFPALRFDARLPRRPWHRWQHIYMVRLSTDVAADVASSGAGHSFGRFKWGSSVQCNAVAAAVSPYSIGRWQPAVRGGSQVIRVEDGR